MRALVLLLVLLVGGPAWAQVQTAQGCPPSGCTMPGTYRFTGAVTVSGGAVVPQGQSVLFAPGTSFAGATAVGGAVKTVAVVCYAFSTSFCPSGSSGQATNVISLPATYNYSSTLTVTATQGASKITFGSSVCYDVMAGSQITIAGLGAGGANYVGHIIGCNGSQPSATLTVDTPVAIPATAQSLAVTFGPTTTAGGLTSGFPAGMAQIMVQGWQGGNAGVTGSALTVSSYTPSALTVSAAAGGVQVNQAVTLIMAAADDSVAMGNACAAAMGTPQRTLYVQGQFYAPNLPDTCYQVILQAVDNTAALFTGAGWLSNANGAGNGGSHKEFLIPPQVVKASPPGKTIIGTRDLLASRYAQPTEVVVHLGDSLETAMPNGLNSSGTYPLAFDKAFVRDNPTVSYTVDDCGVGGLTVALQDGNPAAVGGCWTSTGTSYVTQLAALNPTLVKWGIGNNDGSGFNLSNFTDLVWRIKFNAASQFSTAPDLVLSSHHPYARVTSGSTGLTASEQQLYGAGFMRSFAAVEGGIRYIDGSAEGVKRVWGYDLSKPALFRNPTFPYGANSTNLPLEPTNTTHGGFVWGLTYTDHQSTFWGRMTGNGGVTDSRGSFIAFVIGSNQAYTQTFDNIAWVFYNTGTNQFSYECDPDLWHPGLGCINPATGAPPVTPSLTSSITVANTGTGGHAVITASTPAFFNCVVGGTVAVPMAGANHAVPNFGNNFSYTEPMIGTVAAAGCVSSTQINLTAAAPTTYASQTGLIMFGNPVISTTVTDVGLNNSYTNSSTTELLQAELVGTHLRIWSQQTTNAIYSGPVMRWDGAEFAPLVFSGGNAPAITVAADTNGGTTYQTGDYQIVLPDFTEPEVVGPSDAAPMSYGSIYGGPCGGDGNNHNCQSFGAAVIDPLLAANDFGLGVGQGVSVQTPTTGFSITVGSNGAGRLQLTPAGTLATGTVTLPAAYPSGQPFILGTTQTITALTVNAPTGLTVTGAPTTLAANTSATFYLDGTVWHRTN